MWTHLLVDFITKNAGEHIRGTECDQKILSQGQSQGNVYSPNYPFPYLPKIVCRYFIYGLQDPQHLERVRLDFDKFDVPSNANVRNSEEDVLNTSNAPKYVLLFTLSLITYLEHLKANHISRDMSNLNFANFM